MVRRGSWLSTLAPLFMLGACAPDPAPAAKTESLPALVAGSARSEASLQALAQGQLSLDRDGCLRVGEHGPFLIWSYGSHISRSADGRVQVTDGASRNVVQIRQEFAVAGAGVDVPPTQLTQPVPSACAKGRFWLAGPVMSEADRQAMLARRQRPSAQPDALPAVRP